MPFNNASNPFVTIKFDLKYKYDENLALFTNKINKQHPQTSHFHAIYLNVNCMELHLHTQKRDFGTSLSSMISRQIPTT